MLIYNAINPINSGLDLTAEPVLADFWRDNSGPLPQTIVWLSRADCSVLTWSQVKDLMKIVTNELESETVRQTKTNELLLSFSGLQAVKTLVDVRKLKPDYNGYIALDHELYAYMSPFHGIVYTALKKAILGAFPKAKVMEYGSLPADWVRAYSGRLPELNAMIGSVSQSPLGHMPHLYVPSAGYLKDMAQFERTIKDNVARWKGMCELVVVNPIMSDPGDDYTKGVPVPLEAMLIILRAVNGIGAGAAVWQAHANPDQAARIVAAMQANIVPALVQINAETPKIVKTVKVAVTEKNIKPMS